MAAYRHLSIPFAIACLLHHGAHSATIHVDDHAAFAGLGWRGPYEAAGDASDLPEDMGEDVRELEGRGFWYFYANGDSTEVDITWTVPEEILSSPWTTLDFRYYTTGTVTLEPVKDTYVEVVQPTVGSTWSLHSSNIEWYGGNQIIFKIMPGPQGYLIFDHMTVEYEGPLPPTPTPGPHPISTTEQGTDVATEITAATSEATEAPTAVPSPSTNFPTSPTEPPFTTTTPTSWPSTPIEEPSTSQSPTFPVSTTFQSTTIDASTPTPTTTPGYPPAPTQPGDPCHPLLVPCDPLVAPNTECRIGESPLLHRCFCVQSTDLSLDGRRCLDKALVVGAGCDSDLQCSGLAGTWCSVNEHSYKYCTCLPQHRPSASERFCLPNVERLGLPCIESVQCTTEGAQCLNFTCTCNDAGGVWLVQSRDGLRCLPVSAWGQPCEEAEQCLAILGQFGTCDRHTPVDSGVCSCRAPTQNVGTVCYRPVPLHQPCALDEECTLGANSSLATCATSKWCACIPGTLEWDTKCYADLSIGDECENVEQCNVPIAGDVFCEPVNGICLCKAPGAVGVNGEKLCRPVNGSVALHTICAIFVQISAASMHLVLAFSLKP